MVSLANSSGVNLSINGTITFLLGIIAKHQAQNFPIFGTYYVNTVALNFLIIKYLMGINVLPSDFLQ